jgi:hypothetical protein
VLLGRLDGKQSERHPGALYSIHRKQLNDIQ